MKNNRNLINLCIELYIWKHHMEKKIFTKFSIDSVGASSCHDSLIFMSTHKATAARRLSRHQATYGLPPSAWPL